MLFTTSAQHLSKTIFEIAKLTTLFNVLYNYTEVVNLKQALIFLKLYLYIDILKSVLKK